MLKVDKCFDKNAKFHFKIHLIPLKEHTPVVTKVPFSRQNAPDLFVRGPQDLQARKRYIIQYNNINGKAEPVLDTKN